MVTLHVMYFYRQVHPVTLRLSSHEHYLLSNLVGNEDNHGDVLGQIFDFISSDISLKVSPPLTVYDYT